GVIKMVLAIGHGILPQTLHIDQPSSKVDWSAGAVQLLTEQREWPSDGRPRRAGVSSFGVSGTNAHVILEQAPGGPAPGGPAPGTGPGGGGLDPATALDMGVVGALTVLPVVISACSAPGLSAQAAQLASYLTSQEPAPARLGDLAYSLLTSRTLWDHRAV